MPDSQSQQALRLSYAVTEQLARGQSRGSIVSATGINGSAWRTVIVATHRLILHDCASID